MTAGRYRIGQIVPSSNTTMETEIPAMLRAREAVAPERFTFHSSRMRMKTVCKEELEAMDRDSDRCAAELADARVDVMGYACLVAIMSMGKGYHRASRERLEAVTARETGSTIPVVTSAGALVEGLQALGAKKIAMVAPYVESLTCLVADYIEAEGITVVDRIALEIPDNLEVGRRDPLLLIDIYKRLNLTGADALVLSSCVQMPSLAAVPIVERECGLPVVSASICTTYRMLGHLGLPTHVPDAGALLSGRY
ncbi:MAG: Asp/Glu racemase [Vicinamibacterales bacterium]